MRWPLQAGFASFIHPKQQKWSFLSLKCSSKMLQYFMIHMILLERASPKRDIPKQFTSRGSTGCSLAQLLQAPPHQHCSDSKKSYEMSILSDMGRWCKTVHNSVWSDSHFDGGISKATRYHPWFGKTNNDLTLTSMGSPYVSTLMFQVGGLSGWMSHQRFHFECVTSACSNQLQGLVCLQGYEERICQGMRCGSSDYPNQIQKMPINEFNHHLNSWNANYRIEETY